VAEKRMFSKQIIDSDAFLEMPLSTQALYFHLSMRADDDGFVDNPKKIQRMVSASGDDLKLLTAKRYILTFDNGVIVIKHWRIHNTLRTDRYKETVYLEEKALLDIKDNRSYTEKSKLLDVGLPNGNQWEPQISIDKISIDKENTYSAFFESVWNLYPNKKGKGQVSQAKKKALQKIGIDEITRAIDRYKAELIKDDWRKQQNGSTFFNSGYIDYLDANYSPTKESSIKKKKTGFSNFEEREYDFDDLVNKKQLKQNGGNGNG
jgi:hypothetical protein